MSCSELQDSALAISEQRSLAVHRKKVAFQEGFRGLIFLTKGYLDTFEDVGFQEWDLAIIPGSGDEKRYCITLALDSGRELESAMVNGWMPFAYVDFELEDSSGFTISARAFEWVFMTNEMSDYLTDQMSGLLAQYRCCADQLADC